MLSTSESNGQKRVEPVGDDERRSLRAGVGVIAAQSSIPSAPTIAYHHLSHAYGRKDQDGYRLVRRYRKKRIILTQADPGDNVRSNLRTLTKPLP